MSDPQLTPPAPTVKPAKPYPDFPLTPHPSGHWCKKIRGKVHFFGPWGRRVNGTLERLPGNGADEALARYNEQAADLHAGRKPRPEAGALTVKALCNDFLNVKQTLVKSGELSRQSWVEYRRACDLLVERFGKGRLVADLAPEDFGALREVMAARWGPIRLGLTIQRVRSVFKYAFEVGLIDTPVRFGPSFVRPSAKVLRLHKAKGGPKLFTAEEVRRIIEAARQTLKAMTLLGINAGFGNADCGTLPLSALDLDGGWVTYPRPKTGIARRCPLWPETVAAIREAMTGRTEPKDERDARLVFLTHRGLAWSRDQPTGPVSREFNKLLRKLGINGRNRLGFYTLRHTFRTVADEAKDQPAADYMMGHQVAHMSSVYREGIADERLRDVAEHVRAWLFAPSAAGPG
jgi:integrase